MQQVTINFDTIIKLINNIKQTQSKLLETIESLKREYEINEKGLIELEKELITDIDNRADNRFELFKLEFLSNYETIDSTGSFKINISYMDKDRIDSWLSDGNYNVKVNDNIRWFKKYMGYDTVSYEFYKNKHNTGYVRVETK